MIVDEGSGFMQQFGSVVASPGIAEKGSLNILVEVTASQRKVLQRAVP